MRLFFADGCPYAHRTRALLTLLGQPFSPEVVDLKNKSPQFLALSPTGAVPLLEDDGLVLFESAVINEYLAEKFAWPHAFSADLRQRARERLMMKRFDDLIVSTFFQSVKDPAVLEQKPNWRREVTILGEVVRDRAPASLLGLHIAPHWLRMNWLAPGSAMLTAMRDAAGAWLEAVVTLPAVVSTSPDRDVTTRHLKALFSVA
jgi:glutathione S-transferase